MSLRGGKSVTPVAVPLFDKAVAVFKKLFQSDTDVRSARLRFRNVNQGPDESNATYLANLREAVETCNFGVLSDEMLRDRFIEGCRSDQLHDKLIMTDNLTLPKCSACRAPTVSVLVTFLCVLPVSLRSGTAATSECSVR